MTPLQYLISQLTPIVQAHNPGAPSDEVAQYVSDLIGFQVGIFLPNLQADLTTGKISFVVPEGS